MGRIQSYVASQYGNYNTNLRVSLFAAPAAI